MPNHVLQRTRPLRAGCNRTPSRAASLSLGRKTVIIERKLFGGTCVNVGCIPTKTLIASARAAHVARHAADVSENTWPDFAHRGYQK